MRLSSDLISQFVKITNDDKKKEKETTIYGTTVKYGDKMYVRIDGSDILTPMASTASMKDKERVIVMIKNHQAIVTGNVTSKSASESSVEDLDKTTKEIKESTGAVDNRIVAAEANISKLQAIDVEIKNSLTAAEADIDDLEADNVTIHETLSANTADINTLKTKVGKIDDLTAITADIESLEADNVTINNTLTAHTADIQSLQTDKLSATDADLKYANIDFSNIGKAAMEYLYSESGLIENVTIGDGTITGKIVGVTISGDLIEGNTVVANKLVIKGTDGLYYKLNTDGVTTEAEQTDYNSLDGSIIKAQSITATKISVDDLVAFDATIGGFNITSSAIYSGVKETVGNTTRGIYLDKNGQIAFGDANNFVKYYQDTDGNYKLEISAQNLKFGAGNQNVETAFEEMQAASTDKDTRLAEVETAIENLSNSISMLVTDGTGVSLMTQTEDGWTFRTSEIQSIVDETSENLDTLTNDIGDINNTVEVLQQTVNDLGLFSEYIKIGTYENEPCIELGESDSDFKLIITNTRILFMEGTNLPAYISNQSLHIEKAVIEEELQQGGFVWTVRNNGNMGLVWKGGTS